MPDSSTEKSALQDNIERKGKNAYYFAHSHKADGPAWDGKQEPKLLARHASTEGSKSKLTFDYRKSNITQYAFLDDGMKVKLYITLTGVEQTDDLDVALDYTDTSLSLVLRNYKETPQCLIFGKLTAAITQATYRIKTDQVIVTLKKAAEGEWHTISDKGAPDHEVV